MKTTHDIVSKLNAMQQSKWIRPALMMLALLAVFGVTGCQPHH
jgi:hypothetical protein